MSAVAVSVDVVGTVVGEGVSVSSDFSSSGGRACGSVFMPLVKVIVTT